MKKTFVLLLCLASILIVFSCDGGNWPGGGGNGGCGITPPDDGNNGDNGNDGDTCTGNCACGPDAKKVDVTTRGSGTYGLTTFMTPTQVGIVSLKTTLTVPKAPSGSSSRGTLFIWPGLEPGSGSIMNYGVLQPVLTWGSSCAKAVAPKDTWWIAGMYVTSWGVCHSGDTMNVNIGDKLDIEMTLNGTMWTQVVTNRSNGRSVSFDISMNGAPQYYALFDIEEWSQAVKPTEDVIFTDTVIKFAKSSPSSCMPNAMGPTDWVSPLYVSKDGTTCCIPKIILRSRGVPATTPNEP